jgi:hypothetical protein
MQRKEVIPPTAGRSPLAERELSRRALVAGSAAGVFGLGALLRLLEALGADPALAHAPTQGLSPGDPKVREGMAAYADTIVPGPAGGADPDPGAVEAGVVEEMYDPFYGAQGAFPAINADLQAATPLVLGRPASFDLDLPYRDRERVVLDRIEGGDSPLAILYAAIATLVWQIYYGVAASEKGVRYIHFPPHSDGYWPQHSYGIRFRSMTRHGYPR